MREYEFLYKKQGVLFVKEKLGFKSNLLLGSLLFGLFLGRQFDISCLYGTVGRE